MLLSRMNNRSFLQSVVLRSGITNTGNIASALSTSSSTSSSSSSTASNTTILTKAFSSSSAPPTSSPTSFSHDKIATDERYASTAEVPESLSSSNSNNQVDGGYSIRGGFREGRAAYLDMSATTPLDPRVFDKMAPYMVRAICYSFFFF